MTTTIEISESVASGYRSLATPLDDTWETIMKSVLDFVLDREAEFRASRGRVAQPIEQSEKHRPDAMEEGHLSRMAANVRSLYENFRDAALGVGHGAQVGAVASYVRFSVGGRNFAVVIAQRNGLLVYLRPEATDLSQGGTTDVLGIQVHRSPRKNWPLDTYFKLSPSSNLDGVSQLLRQSYEAVR